MQCSFLLTSMVLRRKPTFWYFLWASFQLSPNMMLKCLPMVLLVRCRSRCLQSQHLGVMAKGSRLLERDLHNLPLIALYIQIYLLLKERYYTHSLLSQTGAFALLAYSLHGKIVLSIVLALLSSYLLPCLL